MTDNISRMYELAGIEKGFKAYTEDGIVKYFHTLDEIIKSNIYYRPDMYCCDLDDDAKEFPPFTDTKQLNLIKWISLNTRYMWNYIGQTVKNTWVLAIDYTQIFKFKSCEHADFSQSLAGLVCELWEDLTEQQREEIKEILG